MFFRHLILCICQ